MSANLTIAFPPISMFPVFPILILSPGFMAISASKGGIYYLEDTGSANGTYVNHNPLPPAIVIVFGQAIAFPLVKETK
jgi:hypothetical protein